MTFESDSVAGKLGVAIGANANDNVARMAIIDGLQSVHSDPILRAYLQDYLKDGESIATISAAINAAERGQNGDAQCGLTSLILNGPMHASSKWRSTISYLLSPERTTTSDSCVPAQIALLQTITSQMLSDDLRLLSGGSIPKIVAERIAQGGPNYDVTFVTPLDKFISEAVVSSPVRVTLPSIPYFVEKGLSGKETDVTSALNGMLWAGTLVDQCDSAAHSLGVHLLRLEEKLEKDVELPIRVLLARKCYNLAVRRLASGQIRDLVSFYRWYAIAVSSSCRLAKLGAPTDFRRLDQHEVFVVNDHIAIEKEIWLGLRNPIDEISKMTSKCVSVPASSGITEQRASGGTRRVP